MKVEIQKRAVEAFKRFAKKRFPHEALGILLGHIIEDKTGEIIQIQDIFIPKAQLINSQTDEVCYTTSCWKEATKAGAIKNLQIIGTVHTHPYSWKEFKGICFDAVPSRGDYENWATAEMLCGIMNIVESKKGRKQCSPISFWHPVESAHADEKSAIIKIEK